MKKARMNISHSRFILSELKIFGEIVTTFWISNCLEMKFQFSHFVSFEIHIFSFARFFAHAIGQPGLTPKPLNLET